MLVTVRHKTGDTTLTYIYRSHFCGKGEWQERECASMTELCVSERAGHLIILETGSAHGRMIQRAVSVLMATSFSTNAVTSCRVVKNVLGSLGGQTCAERPGQVTRAKCCSLSKVFTTIVR